MEQHLAQQQQTGALFGLAHTIPPAKLVRTLAILLVLTAITVYTAKFVYLGVFNIALVILLASAKAGLVMAVFMHLQYESKLIIAIAFYPVLIFAIFFGGTLHDVLKRDELPALNPPGSSPAGSQPAGALAPSGKPEMNPSK